MNLQNMPEVKMGIVAVSRDCFPMTLSENRRKAVVAAYKGEIYECPTVVESEVDMQKALKELREAGCNALVVYLGNFGPETAETLLVKYFHGPCMVVAAAEEGDLVQGRGDAYCGMLNASYNLKLRNLKAYIPEYPVGTAAEVADMIEEFVPIARAIVALKNLKVISFGPVLRTSWPATLLSRDCMTWESRSKRTLNWIFLKPLRNMKGIHVLKKLQKIWRKNWAKAI